MIKVILVLTIIGTILHAMELMVDLYPYMN